MIWSLNTQGLKTKFSLITEVAHYVLHTNKCFWTSSCDEAQYRQIKTRIIKPDVIKMLFYITQTVPLLCKKQKQ